MDNQTKFYAKEYEEVIATVDGIIFLNKGDIFLGKKGELYQINWKVYNPFSNFMVYHGELINNIS